MISKFSLGLVALALCFACPSSYAQTVSARTTPGIKADMPYELDVCLEDEPTVEADGRINPFYLSGDFDGDGITDFAVQVKSKTSKAYDVLFCFGNGKRILWPAGGSNDAQYDCWWLMPKGGKLLSVYPQVKHDAINVGITDEGGGVLYWTGKKFGWIPQD